MDPSLPGKDRGGVDCKLSANLCHKLGMNSPINDNGRSPPDTFLQGAIFSTGNLPKYIS